MIPPKKTKKKPLLLSKNKKDSFSTGISEDFFERIQNEKAFKNRNYLFYLSSLLQRSHGYHLWHRYLTFFRKFKLISLLFRLYSYFLVLLQLGTAFFVVILGFLLLLPILLLGAGLVIFSSLLLYRRENKNMGPILKTQNTLVFFPTRGNELAEGSFFRSHIEEISKRPDSLILIVSPYFWSGKGITGTRFYFLLRKEKENVYMVRKHYYFSLKKAVLNKNPNSLTLIY